ncbi:MAG: SUMF1/EgtB/PvdO family nonheme iron enzyme [Planctomycetota bacterium]
MKTNIKSLVTCVLVVCFVPAKSEASNIHFGSGANAFSMEFVAIGDPGNVADATGTPSPAGSVGYTYYMGKHEVSRDMIAKANASGGLGITLDSMSSVSGGPRADMAATGVTWFEAAQFANYLNTSKGFLAAYRFDTSGNFQLWQSGDAGYDAANPFRNSLANFVLPTADEWYKAAYYDGVGGYFDYATASNSIPTPVSSGTGAGTAVFAQTLSQGPADITLAGGFSALGTRGQNGNVFEWEESNFDLINDSVLSPRGVRGAGFSNVITSLLSSSSRLEVGPSFQNFDLGFRVASLSPVPEPGTAAGLASLLGIGGATGMRRRRRE